MVHDHVWATAGMSKDSHRQYLCVGCLERRLRRRLTPGDFTDALVNGSLLPNKSFCQLRSAILADRLAEPCHWTRSRYQQLALDL